jgi:hypothetical protein
MCRERGKKYNFQKGGGGISIVFGLKYRPLQKEVNRLAGEGRQNTARGNKEASKGGKKRGPRRNRSIGKNHGKGKG